MRIVMLFLVVIFFSCSDEGSPGRVDPAGDGTIIVKKIADLSPELQEASGIIAVNNKLVLHNDSSGEAVLYEVDPVTAKILRKVRIEGVKNRDFEDIAQDEVFIYIADIGNNSNTRKDLAIYRIRKSDFSGKNSVKPEVISFRYEDQIDFTKTEQQTNFDAEALVAFEGKLLIFTKNWGDHQTSVYSLPGSPGSFIARKKGTYAIKGLVTGATYSPAKKWIVMTGYSNFVPFVVKLSGFPVENPLDGKVEKHTLLLLGSNQLEGIASNPDGSFTLCTEGSAGLPAAIYHLQFQ